MTDPLPNLVEHLVSAFARADVPGPGVWTPAELGLLGHAREVFLAAGAEQVRRLLSPASWLQVGVSFADPAQKQRFQSSSLIPEAVEAWLAGGSVDRFFFMNKPPGMRLRFSVPHGGDAERQVIGLLDRARSEGLVAAWEFGIYDQETHQFGGVAGLDLFHRFSTCDSLAIWRFAALEAAGRATIDRSVLSLLALNDLVARMAEDRWEQWDVWCEMRLTGRAVDPDSEVAEQLREDLDQNRELLESLVDRREEVVADLAPEERALVESYQQANTSIAAGFREACRARTLGCGPRKILPFFVIFHWNRLGLELDEQVAFSFFMRELLNPKQAGS